MREARASACRVRYFAGQRAILSGSICVLSKHKSPLKPNYWPASLVALLSTGGRKRKLPGCASDRARAACHGHEIVRIQPGWSGEPKVAIQRALCTEEESMLVRDSPPERDARQKAVSCKRRLCIRAPLEGRPRCPTTLSSSHDL